MKEFTENEKKQMFDALRILRDAVNIQAVSASDILSLVRRKLDQRNGNDRYQRPPQNQQWHKRHNQQQTPQKQGHVPTIQIQCRYCHGLGFSSTQPCPVCKGAKLIAVPRDSVECGNCHGLGFSSARPCVACNGTSRVSVQTYR